MRRRRFGFGARGFRKRSVAWIPGFNTFDDSVAIGDASRLLTFTRVETGFQTFGAAVQLTSDTDLSLHGGEDAVFQRGRGRLLLFNGQRNDGGGLAATPFFCRIIVAQTDTTPVGNVMPFRFTSGALLGNDDILWYRDVYCTNATGFVDTVNPTITLEDHWFDVDIKARRKLQSDRQIVMWFQAVVPAATTALQCRVVGGIRLLLKRPR